MKSRHGIGISEASQLNYSNFCVRVYRPGTGFVATLVNVGDVVGTVRFDPVTNGRNSSFGPATLSAYPSAVAGDYVVVDAGTHHVAPTSGGTGAGIFTTDTSGSDLPIDDSTTSNFNSWWQFGPATDAVPTYPPIWDVGPASTEDGMQLLSGLRLYYGAEASQYVYVSSPTTANQYSHYEESLHTTDPAISNATQALVLANSILARRKYEERTYNVSVGPLDENEITLLKPGQLIDIKARAIPDADDQFVSRRIAQLKWTTPVPGMFFAHMQLDRPIKEVPHSVGNKAGHEAIGQHALNGSNSHPEFIPRAILTTQGDMLYRGASDVQRLALGSSNTHLISDGVIPRWITNTGSGGVSDHGSLTGLPDNDHPQYRLTTDGGQDVISVVAASGSTETLDLDDGNVHDVTLTANCTLTLTGATNGVSCDLSILLRQDGTGSRTVTWPASVEWVGDAAPTLQTAASSWDWVHLRTLDGGTTWYGQHAGTTTSSSSTGGHILIADVHSTPLVFDDLLQNDDGDDLLYADT
jgi:hypothetical protein